jgi:hypothetical protein
MEEFMGKSVAVKGFIFQKSGMKANGDLSGVKTETAAANQFGTSFLKASHTQTVIVH